MKKFNPDLELSKLQNKKDSNYNSSKVNNVFVPLLIVGCSCLAMIGVTFSAQLANDGKGNYTVKVDIINGKEDTYIKKVSEGAFSDTIEGLGTFGSITCTEGSLNYDSATSTISNVLINQDTTCILAFMDPIADGINLDELDKINDNTGTSYYFRADSENNYIKIKNDTYRIIRVNGDGSIRVMLDNVILTALYGDYNNYADSGVKSVIDKWFNDTFNNEKYLVEGDFDTTNYDNYDFSDKHLVNIYGYSIFYAGTLSVREATIISKNVTGDNYLNTAQGIYLANPNGAYETYMFKEGKVGSIEPNTVLNVKPVINIGNVKLSGQGTINDPYVIEED